MSLARCPAHAHQARTDVKVPNQPDAYADTQTLANNRDDIYIDRTEPFSVCKAWKMLPGSSERCTSSTSAALHSSTANSTFIQRHMVTPKHSQTASTAHNNPWVLSYRNHASQDTTLARLGLLACFHFSHCVEHIHTHRHTAIHIRATCRTPSQPLAS